MYKFLMIRSSMVDSSKITKLFYNWLLKTFFKKDLKITDLEFKASTYESNTAELKNRLKEKDRKIDNLLNILNTIEIMKTDEYKEVLKHCDYEDELKKQLIEHGIIEE